MWLYDTMFSINSQKQLYYGTPSQKASAFISLYLNSTTLFLVCQPFSYYAVSYENISHAKGLRAFLLIELLFIFIN